MAPWPMVIPPGLVGKSSFGRVAGRGYWRHAKAMLQSMTVVLAVWLLMSALIGRTWGADPSGFSSGGFAGRAAAPDILSPQNNSLKNLMLGKVQVTEEKIEHDRLLADPNGEVIGGYDSKLIDTDKNGIVNWDGLPAVQPLPYRNLP